MFEDQIIKIANMNLLLVKKMASCSIGRIHEVPVVIIEADNLKSLELAIIENVQKDLNAIEEAESYKNLIDNFGYDKNKYHNL